MASFDKRPTFHTQTVRVEVDPNPAFDVLGRFPTGKEFTQVYTKRPLHALQWYRGKDGKCGVYLSTKGLFKAGDQAEEHMRVTFDCSEETLLQIAAAFDALRQSLPFEPGVEYGFSSDPTEVAEINRELDAVPA